MSSQSEKSSPQSASIRQYVKSPSDRGNIIMDIMEQLDQLKSQIEDSFQRGTHVSEDLKKKVQSDFRKLELLNPGTYRPSGNLSVSPFLATNYIQFVPLSNTAKDTILYKGDFEAQTEDSLQQKDSVKDKFYSSNSLLEVFSVLILDLLNKYKPQQYKETFQKFLSLDLDKFESTKAFLVKHKVSKENFKKSVSQYRALIDKSSAFSQARDSQFLKEYLTTLVKYFVLQKATIDQNDQLIEYLEKGYCSSGTKQKSLENTLAQIFGLTLTSQNMGVTKLIFSLGQGKLVIFYCQNSFKGQITSSSQLSPYRKLK